jgi:alginate O-acetyltransferase complex protein AlgJ
MVQWTLKQRWIERTIVGLIVGMVALAFASRSQANDDAFAAALAPLILPQASIRGVDDTWFFLTKELKHLSTGAFWEKPWTEVAANKADPIPSMVEFQELLAAKGIALLIVPIPAKATIYPEKLVPGFPAGSVGRSEGMVALLRKKGLKVLDVESAFLAEREAGQLFCQQDAHFSPRAAELIAHSVVAELGLTSSGGAEYTLGSAESLTIAGDQVKGTLLEGQVAAETLSLQAVSYQGQRGVAPDPAASVLLLGDSHTLVFSDGTDPAMHCTGAGVLDHLAYLIQAPVSRVGAKASGLVQARKQLFYDFGQNKAFWDAKKAVVWMFSTREFTQTTSPYRPIPIEG